MSRAEGVVRRLFERYAADPAAMPEEWRPDPAKARPAMPGRSPISSPE